LRWYVPTTDPSHRWFVGGLLYHYGDQGAADRSFRDTPTRGGRWPISSRQPTVSPDSGLDHLCEDELFWYAEFLAQFLVHLFTQRTTYLPSLDLDDEPTNIDESDTPIRANHNLNLSDLFLVSMQFSPVAPPDNDHTQYVWHSPTSRLAGAPTTTDTHLDLDGGGVWCHEEIARMFYCLGRASRFTQAARLWNCNMERG
jgi:hypothetical protein